MQHRWRNLALIQLALAILLVPGSLRAQDADIPRQHHAWARFGPGSWKLVRIVTETFDAQGRISGASITETKTTLKEAGPDGFTLTIESTVELDGKRITNEPQQVTQQYNGALHGQSARARVLGEESVMIDGKEYPCRLLQYEIVGANHKSVTRTHYSEDVPPYVLRRETVSTDTAANKVTSRVLVEVKELNVPFMACGQTHQTARMRVEQKHAKGTETTEALSSVLVPGGVVRHDSTLVDAAGKKLSHSKLELVDYHAVPRDPPEARPKDAHEATGATREGGWRKAGVWHLPAFLLSRRRFCYD